MNRLVLGLVSFTLAAMVLTDGVSAAQKKGRWKKEGGKCVYVANDSGPDQCEPPARGRWKKDGGKCVWAGDESGPDQCSRPGGGRFKKEGNRCVWAAEAGPDQCDPKVPR
jgi:hypothetical protein